MQNDQTAKDNTVSRHEFYRDGFRASLAINLGVTAALAGSVWLNVYQATHPTPGHVIAVTDHGQLTEVLPMSETRMTPAAMEQWAVDQVMKVCNIDWVHYRKQLDDAMAENAFTEAAWNGLMTQMPRAPYARSPRGRPHHPDMHNQGCGPD